MASSVKLGDKLESVIDELVESGRYGSRSEVLREGVRLVHERESWVEMAQAAAEEGRTQIARGEGRPLAEVMDELRERYRTWSQ